MGFSVIALIQRVTQASVTVAGECIAEIDTGLLVLLAVHKNDEEKDARRMAERLSAYRVFADSQDKMNLSVTDIAGEVLLVPQFTLAADTDRGLRPSFHLAAEPDKGRHLFGLVFECLSQQQLRVCQGQFGADMKVQLINDGPVTFSLKTGSA